jgi:hypothetical protein
VRRDAKPAALREYWPVKYEIQQREDYPNYAAM